MTFWLFRRVVCINHLLLRNNGIAERRETKTFVVFSHAVVIAVRFRFRFRLHSSFYCIERELNALVLHCRKRKANVCACFSINWIQLVFDRKYAELWVSISRQTQVSSSHCRLRVRFFHNSVLFQLKFVSLSRQRERTSACTHKHPNAINLNWKIRHSIAKCKWISLFRFARTEHKCAIAHASRLMYVTRAIQSLSCCTVIKIAKRSLNSFIIELQQQKRIHFNVLSRFVRIASQQCERKFRNEPFFATNPINFHFHFVEAVVDGCCLSFFTVKFACS